MNTDLQKQTIFFLIFGSKFGFRGPFVMGKITHTIDNYIFPLKWGFGIGYGIGRKYRQMRVLVSLSDLNQNIDFGHTLFWRTLWAFRFRVLEIWSSLYSHMLNLGNLSGVNENLGPYLFGIFEFLETQIWDNKYNMINSIFKP